MPEKEARVAAVDDIEFLDHVRSLPAAAARKEQLPVSLGIASGDRVIELGPGTGDDLQRFAERAGGDGLAVGVDVSADLLNEAARRAPDAVLVLGDARRLPFRERAFARGYAERVLQHVPEVQEAIAELHRVLQPGGLVLVFEPDQELRAVDHPDFELERLLRPRLAPQVANPAIGRQLVRLLTNAGFSVSSVEGTAAGQLGPASVDRTVSVVEDAIAEGRIEASRGVRYLDTLRSIDAAGPVFSVWVAFEVAATRPE